MAQPKRLVRRHRAGRQMNGSRGQIECLPVPVKHGSKTDPWQIDAIAGATVTSKAVGRGINESAQKLMPLLVPHLDAVKVEGSGTAPAAASDKGVQS